MASNPYYPDGMQGGTPTAPATDAAGTPGHTDSNSRYAGPAGYLYDLTQGKQGSFTDYLDPGDFFGDKGSADALAAGKQAASYLAQLSQTAWDRQMTGLQRALGSMNNYNDVLSNLYGVKTNHYDPNGSGGVMGPDAPPAGPQVFPPKQTQWNNPSGIVPGSAPPNNSGWAPPAGGGSPQPTSGWANPDTSGIVPGSGAGGASFAPGGDPGSAPVGSSGWTNPILAKIAAMLGPSSGPVTETRSGRGHF